ncbi:DUF4252 domain-containing protein [Chitinophaga sp. LS1]|uniref:DUF4252 domain-containing protein n=1 Tax=Chitinophaga sp. LS1 TaxID=3051176 RepID=UPI002AAB44CD|nr:DUF4252 domain-containing protein [Chitinophaga sp. LS1]WPV64192.1 DUF4252 domain-containing protein [Chitinophaga sp. LS1]
MKHCLVLSIVCCLLLGTSTTHAQDRLLTQFYNAHRGVALTLKMGIGRLPLRIVRGFIPNEQGEDGVNAKKLFSKIRKMKVYIMQGYDGPIPGSDLTCLKQKLIDKENFDLLMEVRDHGNIVHVLNKGTEENLGNVVLLIQDEKDMIMVHLHTSLRFEDINGLIKEFNKKPKAMASL